MKDADKLKAHIEKEELRGRLDREREDAQRRARVRSIRPSYAPSSPT